MSQVVWLPSAIADMGEQIAYISMDNPLAAERVAKQLRRVAAGLGFLKTGRIGQVSGTYEKVLTNLPYLLVYTTRTDDAAAEFVVILRVIHTARRWPPSDELDDSEN